MLFDGFHEQAALIAAIGLALCAACGSPSGDTDAGVSTDSGSTQGDAGADGGPVAAADAGTDAGPSQDGGTVDGAASGDTWESFAQGFFTTYCVPCHSADPPRDYSTMVDVQRDSAEIRCGVSPTALSGCAGSVPPSQFPIGTGPHPSDAERQRLVAWIEAGMP